MSDVIEFTTDVAALAVFDADVLRHRVREPRDWWRVEPQTSLDEIADGRVGIFRIGKEGSYRTALRVGGDMSDLEEDLEVARLTNFGLVVESGEVFLGAGERLPGGGHGDRLSHIPDTGALLQVEPGEYDLEVVVLRWRNDDAYYDEDNELLPTAPPDYLVLLTAREEPPDVPFEVPTLRDLVPKAETKGKAKVVIQPRRRRSSSPAPRRRRSSGPPPEPGVASRPVPPPSVPEEVAPYSQEQVRAAFRDVLYGNTLHPPEMPTISRISLVPGRPGLLRQDVDMAELFKKTTRVREQGRVLEAKVNGNKGLDLVDKIELQAPVTAVYQSLSELLDYLAEQAPGPE